jgi:hypothetical protein
MAARHYLCHHDSLTWRCSACPAGSRSGGQSPRNPDRTSYAFLPSPSSTKGLCPLGLEPPNVSEGDLNTETGEISPDRGNHATKVTRAGLVRPPIRRRVRCSARHLACTWLGGRCGVSAPAPLTAAVRVSALAAALPGGAPVAGSRGPVRVTFRDERSEHAQVTARYAFWQPGTGSRRSAPRRTFCRTRRHRGVPARAS